ncbi:MAG: hypothetical protein ACOZNI_30155 [Myxococcota bacterium]
MPLEPPPPEVGFDAPPLRLTQLQRDLVAAVVTGQFAGLVMLAAMMVGHGLFLSGDPLLPLRAIGSIAYGEAALRGDAAALTVGFLVHMLGPTLFWSLVFGVLVRATNLRDGVGVAALGPLVGMASQLVDVDLLLPPLARDVSWTSEFLGIKSWFWHLVFGLALTTFPRVYAWLFPADNGR